MIKLYKSLVVSHLENAVWQIRVCDKLEKIQRKGLALCLGCPNTTSCEVLEVQAGTIELGFLRRNLFSCPQDVKEAAYKSLMRPIIEYGSSVWDPHCNGLNGE